MSKNNNHQPDSLSSVANEMSNVPLNTQGETACAEDSKKFENYGDIAKDGNCLFSSILVAMGLQKSLKINELKQMLINLPELRNCGYYDETIGILVKLDAYGNSDIIYLCSVFFEKNICVHIRGHRRMGDLSYSVTHYVHFTNEKTTQWIHLDLEHAHFTPLKEIQKKATVDSCRPDTDTRPGENNKNSGITVNGKVRESTAGFRGVTHEILREKLENKEEGAKLWDYVISLGEELGKIKKEMSEQEQKQTENRPKIMTSTPNEEAVRKGEIEMGRGGYSFAKQKMPLHAALKLIPEYDGKTQGLQGFIAILEKLRKTYGADAEPWLIHTAAKHLKGNAQIASGQVAFAYDTVSEMIEDLKTQFGGAGDVDSMRLQLRTIEQLEGEPVADYAIRVQELEHKLTAIYNAQQGARREEKIHQLAKIKKESLECFLAGLKNPPEYKVLCKNPTSLRDAISKAIVIEERMGFMRRNQATIRISENQEVESEGEES